MLRRLDGRRKRRRLLRAAPTAAAGKSRIRERREDPGQKKGFNLHFVVITCVVISSVVVVSVSVFRCR